MRQSNFVRVAQRPLRHQIRLIRLKIDVGFSVIILWPTRNDRLSGQHFLSCSILVLLINFRDGLIDCSCLVLEEDSHLLLGWRNLNHLLAHVELGHVLHKLDLVHLVC